jgi:phage-related protein/DNA-binding Xre family transcriptional regulator
MDADTPLEVVFYRTESGNEPVRAWLQGLSKQDKRMIGGDIKTVQYGWPIGMPVVRKMEPGLWEVRCRLDQRITRILFTVKGEKMILLHGFIKKSRKTPQADLWWLKIAKPTWRNDMSKHIGSNFDDFLEEEGVLAEAEAIAVKRVLAFQLEELMKAQKLNKTQLARRMKTSRSALERLLDPDNPSVTLLTLERAARALGKNIRIELAV